MRIPGKRLNTFILIWWVRYVTPFSPAFIVLQMLGLTCFMLRPPQSGWIVYSLDFQADEVARNPSLTWTMGFVFNSGVGLTTSVGPGGVRVSSGTSPFGVWDRGHVTLSRCVVSYTYRIVWLEAARLFLSAASNIDSLLVKTGCTQSKIVLSRCFTSSLTDDLRMLECGVVCWCRRNRASFVSISSPLVSLMLISSTAPSVLPAHWTRGGKVRRGLAETRFGQQNFWIRPTLSETAAFGRPYVPNSLRRTVITAAEVVIIIQLQCVSNAHT